MDDDTFVLGEMINEMEDNEFSKTSFKNFV